jgi:ABC-2 type transport system permease protein
LTAVGGVAIGVPLDRDPRQVKDRLQDPGGLTVVEVDSRDTIEALLARSRAHLGLVIPPGFSRRVADGEQTTFELLVDGTMPTLAQSALYGSRVLTDEDAAQALRLDDPEHPSPPPRPFPIKIDQAILFNPQLRDSNFFLPGTVGVVIMLVSLILSTGLVREKEQQTIEQLWSTPISRFALVAGKMIPYAIVTALDFAIVSVLAHVLFELPVRGSLLGVTLLSLLFIFALLALGSLVSIVSDTQLQAQFLNIFVFILSIMMSGFVFPLEAMPTWLLPVARSLPMTYFVEGIRALALKGVPVAAVLHDFVVLALFTLVFGALSLARFHKQVA